MGNIEIHHQSNLPRVNFPELVISVTDTLSEADAAHWSQIITETVALGSDTFDCKVGDSYPRQDGDRSIVDENAIEYCIDQLDEQQVLDALYRVNGQIVGKPPDSPPSDQNVQQAEDDQIKKERRHNLAIVASLTGILAIVFSAFIGHTVFKILLSEATHKK